MATSLAKKTIKAYRPAAYYYSLFFHTTFPRRTLVPWDISESDLLLFLAFYSAPNAVMPHAASKTALHHWLAGLRDLCIQHRTSISAFTSPAVLRVRHSIDRTQPTQPDLRLPISSTLVQQILRVPPLGAPSALAADAAFKFSLALGFTALLRVGEMLVEGPGDLFPRRKDWVLTSYGAKLWLQKFKQSQFAGCWIRLYNAPPGVNFCPVRLGLAALAAAPRKGPLDPLLQNGLGQPLRIDYQRHEIRRRLMVLGVDPTHYTGYSLRIGGATELVRCGATTDEVKTLGRWTSEAWLSYIRAEAGLLGAAVNRVYRCAALPTNSW